MHDFVEMLHPEIDGTVRVGHSAVRVLEKSGWRPVSSDTPAPEGDTDTSTQEG